MSGIRTGEANNLKVRDVERIVDSDGRPTIQLNVKGKTGTRTVHPHIDLEPVIDMMLDRRAPVEPGDWLFRMPSEHNIITLIDQFNTFLKYAGLTHNSAGEKYSLYSLRHYYAVRSLDRTDIYSIAQNMGTSVQIIEEYYGKHGISAERARKLGGEVGHALAPADPFLRFRPKRRPKGKSARSKLVSAKAKSGKAKPED
jgi:integrase